MNDRFKFRFYDEKNNFMITDEDSDENWDKCIELYDKDEWYFCVEKNLTFVLDYFDDKDFVVMQCTGLKDKNGKLIYEGDIVKAKHKPDREGWYCVWRGVVDYDNKNCQYAIKARYYSVLNETRLNKATFENIESFIWFDWLEVIGNIYENKELLEECE